MLKENIEQKIFKIKRENNDEEVYVDLDASSFIRTSSNFKFDSSKEEQQVNFTYNVFRGSFLGKNSDEYLLFIRLAEGEFCSFFYHYENYGNTTFIIIFNENYKQISRVFFQDYYTQLIDIVDINNDSLNEVIMGSSYGQQGCFESWVEIFQKDFDNSLLRVVIYHDCLNTGNKGEKILLESDYEISENKIIFNSKLDYYLCLGVDKSNGYKPINRYMKTEYKVDEFKFEDGEFVHIKSNNNVDWELEQLAF